MKTIERYRRMINIQYVLIVAYTKMIKDYNAVYASIHDDVMMNKITTDEANERYELIENAMERIVSNQHECYATIRYYKRKIADVKRKSEELKK